MARTRQTARRQYDTWEEDEEMSDASSVEDGQQNLDTPSTDEQTQVLEGIAIVPLDFKRDAASQAAALGYGHVPRLVSSWYEHVCSRGCCPTRWSEHDNVEDEEAALTRSTNPVPIVRRHEHRDGQWKTVSITFNDTSMREVLRHVLAKYQDLDPDVENWTFTSPFMPLVHRWEALKHYHQQATTRAIADKDDETQLKLKNAASAMLAFLTSIIATPIKALAKARSGGKITFSNAWLIFAPDSLVMTKFFGVDTVCRVTKYRYVRANSQEPARWVIDLEYVDWSGERCGYNKTSLTIWDFEGYRRVTALPVFPISFLGDKLQGTRAAMIERGRKFESLRGFRYMLCDGTKIRLETKCPEQRPISGKVCVDAYAYYRSCNIVPPVLRSLAEDDSSSSNDNEKKKDKEVNNDTAELSETRYDSAFSCAPVAVESAAKSPHERNEDLAPLSETQLLMTTPWLKGFDLKAKEWCALRVDQLSEMSWNDEAFDKLVLPGGEKELAWSFVENKSHHRHAAAGAQRADGKESSSEVFDDFVAGKGRGLIILMFGPPGVGKTFTAEAVAERCRVPLYSMSAGELGVSPSDVESSLERALELCRMWGAMLLLDEADVFLGARTGESLARNELVSIFLTKLEYYTGTLFLTTNRIASIDHAFQSRVDLFLPYRDLEPAARRTVWENFIARAGGRDKFDMGPDEAAELDRLAGLRLNGREIKNLIKSAQLLSLKSGGKVPLERVYMLADKRVQAMKALDVAEC